MELNSNDFKDAEAIIEKLKDKEMKEEKNSNMKDISNLKIFEGDSDVRISPQYPVLKHWLILCLRAEIIERKQYCLVRKTQLESIQIGNKEILQDIKNIEEYIKMLEAMVDNADAIVNKYSFMKGVNLK